jgi:hypothetical protein
MIELHESGRIEVNRTWLIIFLIAIFLKHTG